MVTLLLGLILFLGVHSVRVVAKDWRSRFIAQRGTGTWKGLYGLLSIVGLALLVWGFGQARLSPVPLWLPPTGMRHATALLTLIAFVLLVAAYVPHNHFKAKLHHPMLLAVKVWALAHLLANGTLADVLLFGSFLLWAVLSFRSARQRDRAQPPASVQATLAGTWITVVVGVLAWAGFAFWAHGAWIDVRPFG